MIFFRVSNKLVRTETNSFPFQYSLSFDVFRRHGLQDMPCCDAHSEHTGERQPNRNSFVNLRKRKEVSYIGTDDSYLTFVVCLLAICQHD